MEQEVSVVEGGVVDAFYNSMLYTPAAGQASKTASKGTLYLQNRWLYATDGYVILATHVDDDSEESLIVGSSVSAHLKDPNNKLETVQSEELTAYWNKVVSFLWGVVHDVPISMKGVVELAPSRLSRLSRLRPTGEYPLSFCFQRESLAFRYGPSTIGVFGTLDRSDLQDLPNGSLW